MPISEEKVLDELYNLSFCANVSDKFWLEYM